MSVVSLVNHDVMKINILSAKPMPTSLSTHSPTSHPLIHLRTIELEMVDRKGEGVVMFILGMPSITRSTINSWVRPILNVEQP